MAIFKTLSFNDVSKVPFNANKLFSFNSSSATTSSVGISLQTFEYSSSFLNTFSSASTDTVNTIKYYQLDHLFYKNNSLYNKVNVLSIPTKLYGNKIKPGTFYYSGSLNTIIDDKKGNLLISGTQLISHSIDEREKVLFIGPIKGFKQYDLDYDLYGKTSPHPKKYYTRENIYDDSFYNNTITYKNIIFKEEDIDDKTTIPSINFIRNAGNNIVNNGDLEISASWEAFDATTAALQTSDLRSSLPTIPNSSLGNFSYQYTVTSTNDGLLQYISIEKGQLYEITWDIYIPPGAANTTNQLTITNTAHPTTGNTYQGGNTAVAGCWVRSRRWTRGTATANSILLFTNGGSTNFGTYYIDNISVKAVNDNGQPKEFSSVVAPHNETYNFNPGEDFAISMHVHPYLADTMYDYTTSPNDWEDVYLACKSTTETTIPVPQYQKALNTTGYSQTTTLKTTKQYPFEIYISPTTGTHQSLMFRKNDGTFTPTISASIDTGSVQHIVCMSSASKMQIWIDGVLKGDVDDTTVFQTENKSDLYIGSKGEEKGFYEGSISNLNIFNSSRTKEQIKSLSSSINGSPYVGNIFYSNGLATATHPKHQEIFKPVYAQVQRYYPLNSTATSPTTNDTSGSFNDLSRYGQNSIAYTYLSASAHYNDAITQNISTATFDTVTHNGFTGELLSISASLSGGLGLNHRGRESVDIPTYQFDRSGKWSLSWLMKETPGFHGTSSAFMGADLDINDGNPLLTQPYIQYHTSNKIYLRTKNIHDFWDSQTTITNRSSSNHHVITWDGTNEKAASMNFYWNGNLLGTHTKDISGHIDSGSFYMETIGAGYWTSNRTTYGYSGSIGQVMFFDHMLTTESIQALNANPSEGAYGSIMNETVFKNIHPIYENEYMCTINADEYNYTHNISTRKIKSDQKPDLANFATGSLFKPYVTTVGLYNEDHELLVVGKLGQPVRMSDETDTTFVLRWDT